MEIAAAYQSVSAATVTTAQESAARPGKSGQSVGHLAKAAVAEARAAGLELPKNAQGFAASRIARGADPATIFAAQVADASPPVDPVAPDEGAGEPLPAVDAQETAPAGMTADSEPADTATDQNAETEPAAAGPTMMAVTAYSVSATGYSFGFHESLLDLFA